MYNQPNKFGDYIDVHILIFWHFCGFV